MKTHLSFVVALIIAGCIACSKSDTSNSMTTPTPTTPADPIQQLSHNWMLQSLSVGWDGGNSVTFYNRDSKTNLLDLSKYRQNLLSTGNYVTTGQSGDTSSKGKWTLANKNTQLVLTDDTNQNASSTLTLDSFSDVAMYTSQITTDAGFFKQAGIDPPNVKQTTIVSNYIQAK